MALLSSYHRERDGRHTTKRQAPPWWTTSSRGDDRPIRQKAMSPRRSTVTSGNCGRIRFVPGFDGLREGTTILPQW